jgi:transketolase
MAALCNGIALHGGLIPYCATFLVFHDYMRPSVRLSCLMGQRVMYIYTHDSIFLGEDGPTHQPIETLCALRAIPGMRVFRPADANETTSCWKAAISHTAGPSAMILTRQGLPNLPKPPESLETTGVQIVREATNPDVVIIGTGSEVATCMEAATLLETKNIHAKVVSMPSVEMFLEQDANFRATILPKGIPRVSVEAATTMGWTRITGTDGANIGINTFGASAPIKDLAKNFGFTAENIAAHAEALTN